MSIISIRPADRTKITWQTICFCDKTLVVVDFQEKNKSICKNMQPTITQLSLCTISYLIPFFVSSLLSFPCYFVDIQHVTPHSQQEEGDTSTSLPAGWCIRTGLLTFCCCYVNPAPLSALSGLFHCQLRCKIKAWDSQSALLSLVWTV